MARFLSWLVTGVMNSWHEIYEEKLVSLLDRASTLI